MCIVRSLNVANKFNFAIGPRLAKYIIHYVNHIDLEELHDIYCNRYKLKYFTIDELHSHVKAIKSQLGVSPKEPIKLPNNKNNTHFQIGLWNNSAYNPQYQFATK